MFVPDLLSLGLDAWSKAPWRISANRQAITQVHSEAVILLLLLVMYFAGFVVSRRWSLCPVPTPKVIGPTSSGPRTHSMVKVGPAEHSAAKIILPTTKRVGQWDTDAHLIKTADRGCLPSDASSLSLLVGACARSGQAAMTLELFDHMLRSGVGCDQRSICNGTASKFFRLVASNLDDEQLQKCGIQLMRTIMAHGLSPSNLVQSQVIRAWNSKLPHQVVEVFVELRESGMRLTSTAYRCVMAAHERSDPAFTLQLYDELLELGVKVDRVAFNAVLCACSHLGMAERALELFERMPELGLAPNGKTYGSVIRACAGGRKPSEALELFGVMRAAGIEPNRCTVRGAIRCCIKLGKLHEANELSRHLAPASADPCSSRCTDHVAACQKTRRPPVDDRIPADTGPACLDDAIWAEDFEVSSRAIRSGAE
ncbi:unnamed protein product [Prorocentrum cordatum]|uniref:PROP1-like PPR domain-containing protein n=1 Tax=Prorocentrum cordatum TaxID=2364126 RepID=A0ABN9PM63_9DINO|nr:unnamed protein product [Polarella glacialis]